MTESVAHRRPAFRSTLITLLLAAVAAGCGGEEDEPSVRVGPLGVPATIVDGLPDAEREIFLDLLAFGAAVGHDELETLGEPIIARAVEPSLISALPPRLGAERLGWADDELRAAYAEDPEWELSVRHVVRLVEPDATQAERTEARRIAEEVAARAVAGEDFADLAGSYSEEPGAAERGGLLQPGRRGSWVEPFWLAANRLRPGDTSGVVESEYGFHVLKLDDRQPVPFEEADLDLLLSRVVPADDAESAMDEWVIRWGGVQIDPAAAGRARDRIVAGDEVPDTLVIAFGADDHTYDGSLLAAGWAMLDPRERTSLEREEDAFLGWVEADAREAIWAQHAADRGVRPQQSAIDGATLDWLRRALTWAQAFGFAPGMSELRTVQQAADARLTGTPEARSARLELRSLRPLLRATYPVEAPAP